MTDSSMPSNSASAPIRCSSLLPLFALFATPLPVAARVLLLFCLSAQAGVTAQGIFSHAATLAIMCVVMMASGAGLTVAFLVARNPRRYLRLCYLTTTVYAFVVTGLYWGCLTLLFYLYPAYVAGYPADLAYLLPLFVLSNLLFLFQNQLLTGLQCFAQYFWINILHAGALMGGIAFLAWTGWWSVSSAFTIWVVSIALPLPWQAAVILRRCDGRWPARRQLHGILRLLVGHTLQSSVATMSDALVFRSGILILRIFCPFSIVGAYAIACSISELVLHLPKGLGVFLLPRLTATRALVTRQALNRYGLMFCVLMVLACIVAVAAPLISLVLHQPEYAMSIRIARILLIGTTLMGWGMLVASHMRATGDVRSVMNASLLSLVVVLVSGFLLVPVFQAYGASIAATLAFATYGLYAARWLLIVRVDPPTCGVPTYLMVQGR